MLLQSLNQIFSQHGINQTVHKIYLEVTCKVSIASQYDSIEGETTNQILMAETMIVGQIPSSYYNFDGLQPIDTTKLVK